jgi:hypothetical protein
MEGPREIGNQFRGSIEGTTFIYQISDSILIVFCYMYLEGNVIHKVENRRICLSLVDLKTSRAVRQ